MDEMDLATSILPERGAGKLYMNRMPGGKDTHLMLWFSPCVHVILSPPTCGAQHACSPSAQLCAGPHGAALPEGSLPPQPCHGPQRAASPPGPPVLPRSSADTAALSRLAAAAHRPGSSPPPAGPHAAAAGSPVPAREMHGSTDM